MLTITTESFRRVTLITVSGRVDSNSNPQLDQKLKDELANGNNNLVINLFGVDYISSAGLRAIVSALRSSKKNGGNLVLSAPSARVREVLDLAGMESLFDIKPSDVEAIGSF